MTRRTLGFLLALALGAGLLPSCNGLSVDFWDEREMDVDVPAGAAVSITDSAVVDLSQDTEIKDKLSQVSKLEVPEVWFEISQVGADNQATTASGSLEVSENVEGATPVVLGHFDNLAIGEGGKTELTLDPDAQAQAEALLMTKGTLKATWSGSLDHVPAVFHLKVRAHIVATIGDGQ